MTGRTEEDFHSLSRPQLLEASPFPNEVEEAAVSSLLKVSSTTAQQPEQRGARRGHVSTAARQ